MASTVLVIGVFCLFFNPIGGVVLLLAGWLLAKREDKYEAKRKKANSAENFYREGKWTHPTSIETLQANKGQRFPSDHSSFLNQQVDRLEKEYRRNGVYTAFPIRWDLPEQEGGLGTIFSAPERYSEVCKFLHREPIPEFLDDWSAQMVEDKNFFNSLVEARVRHDEDSLKQLASLKDRVNTLSQEGFSRKDIINIVRSENSKHVVISCESGIWHIEYFGHKCELPASDYSRS